MARDELEKVQAFRREFLSSYNLLKKALYPHRRRSAARRLHVLLLHKFLGSLDDRLQIERGKLVLAPASHLRVSRLGECLKEAVGHFDLPRYPLRHCGRRELRKVRRGTLH